VHETHAKRHVDNSLLASFGAEVKENSLAYTPHVAGEYKMIALRLLFADKGIFLLLLG
jgi:hypothetical protein